MPRDSHRSNLRRLRQLRNDPVGLAASSSSLATSNNNNNNDNDDGAIDANNATSAQTQLPQQQQQQQRNIPDLIRKLSSISPEDREVACKTLANCLVEESETALDFLLTHNAVPLLLTRLVDHSPAVAAAACGCLRNCVLVGFEPFVAHLLHLNGLTPLLAALPRANSHAAGTASMEQIALLSELIALMSHVAECADSAAVMQLATSNDLLSLLLDRALATDSDHVDIAVAAAQFLYTLVDDNAACANAMMQVRARDGANLMQLLADRIASAPSSLLAVLLAGLLYSVAMLTNNIANSPNALDQLLSVITPPIDAALSLDTVAPFQALVAAMAPLASSAGEEVEPAQWLAATMSPALRTQISHWRTQMTAVRTAVSLWTNVLGEASEAVDDVSLLPPPLTARAQAWLAPLLLRCNVPPVVAELVDAHAHFLASPLLDLELDNFPLAQLLAVRAVNNSLGVLGPLRLGREPQRVWDFLMRLALNGAAGTVPPTDDTQEPLLFSRLDAYALCNAATGAMWTLLRGEPQQQHTIAPSEEQLIAFRDILAIDPSTSPSELVGADADELTSLASLLTNVVGLLGRLGTRAVPTVDHAQATAQSLARLLATYSGDGALVAEVLNALFDCFAEDDYNDALKPFHFVDSLRSFAPHIEQLIAAALEAQDEQLAERLTETLENVHAFTEYKSTR